MNDNAMPIPGYAEIWAEIWPHLVKILVVAVVLAVLAYANPHSVFELFVPQIGAMLVAAGVITLGVAYLPQQTKKPDPFFGCAFIGLGTVLILSWLPQLTTLFSR